jgi:hypothetical protein
MCVVIIAALSPQEQIFYAPQHHTLLESYRYNFASCPRPFERNTATHVANRSTPHARKEFALWR